MVDYKGYKMCEYCGKNRLRKQKTFEVFFPSDFYSRTMYACCEKQLRKIIREECDLNCVPKNTYIEEK